MVQGLIWFPGRSTTSRRQASDQVGNALPLHREPALMAGKGIIPALQRSAPRREVLKGEGHLLPVVDDDDGVFQIHFCLSRVRAYAYAHVYIFLEKCTQRVNSFIFQCQYGYFHLYP